MYLTIGPLVGCRCAVELSVLGLVHIHSQRSLHMLVVEYVTSNVIVEMVQPKTSVTCGEKLELRDLALLRAQNPAESGFLLRTIVLQHDLRSVLGSQDFTNSLLDDS